MRHLFEDDLQIYLSQEKIGTPVYFGMYLCYRALLSKEFIGEGCLYRTTYDVLRYISYLLLI